MTNQEEEPPTDLYYTSERERSVNKNEEINWSDFTNYSFFSNDEPKSLVKIIDDGFFRYG